MKKPDLRPIADNDGDDPDLIQGSRIPGTDTPPDLRREKLAAMFANEIPVLEELTPDSGDETLRHVGYNLSLADVRVIAAALACSPQTGTAPLLPDTFVERAIRVALALPEFKLEGDTVVGLSGFEASFIRDKYAERNR